MARYDDVLIPRGAWGAKPPTRRDTTFTKTGGVVVHYSTRNAAGLVSHWPDCHESWRAHQRFHMVTKGWTDLAYNFGICPHGFIFEGRGWDAQNGANEPANSSTLSVCFDGDNNDYPNYAATQSFKDLIAKAVREEGWNPQVRGHWEVKGDNRPCPGAAIREIMLPDLKTYVANISTAPPTPQPSPNPDPPSPPLDRVVILGSSTVTIAQMQRWAATHSATQRFTGLSTVAFRSSVHIGVDPAITYAIMAHETNFGHFTGVLDPSFHNWGGIKTFVGGGSLDPNAHHRFQNDEIGIRAVAQHAGRYAGLKLPSEFIVDPRWSKVTPGKAPELPDEDWLWAGNTHDDRVVGYVREMRRA